MAITHNQTQLYITPNILKFPIDIKIIKDPIKIYSHGLLLKKNNTQAAPICSILLNPITKLLLYKKI
jgi:hypothetical protein